MKKRSIKKISLLLSLVAGVSVMACVLDTQMAADPAIPAQNAAPRPHAGVDQWVIAGDEVRLDGSGSVDENNDPLSHTWTILGKPAGSTAVIDAIDPIYPTFIADLEGTYTAELSISDGEYTSPPRSVTVHAETPYTGPVFWEDDFLLFYVNDIGGEVDLYVTGKTVLTVSCIFNFHGENMTTTTESPVSTTLQGRKTHLITRFTPIEGAGSAIYYLDLYNIAYGDLEAVHDAEYVYDLPYPAENFFTITQGYNTNYSHFGEFAYSLDFDMPEGEAFYAARSGIVLQVGEEFSESGTDESYKQMTNHVLVAHRDGTWAQYSHSPQNGIVVSAGDFIRKGQLLGYAGNTGYSTVAHLHFGVHKPENFTGLTSTVPTLFRTAEGFGITLEEGETYTSLSSVYE